MRAIIIIIIIFTLGLGGGYLISNIINGPDLEDAIEEIENGNNREALLILKQLHDTGSYESNEKVNYYRCKAIRALAKELNQEYSDELKELPVETNGQITSERKKNKLLKIINEINVETGGDLKISINRETAFIHSSGKLHDDFTANYPGSTLLEDLDFEELQRISTTSPENLGRGIVNYIKKYPGTVYIAQIVKMIYEGLNKGTLIMRGHEDLLMRLIKTYSIKYSSSADTHRIYICRADNVNMRSSPDIEGQRVGRAAKDEILMSLEKSMDTAQAGAERDYWHRVSTLSGKTGWIFGSFLKPCEFSKDDEKETETSWLFTDDFSLWKDSNTPENWRHLKGSQKETTGFISSNNRRVLYVKTDGEKRSGLYRQSCTNAGFCISIKAKNIDKGIIMLTGISLAGGKSYNIFFKGNSLEVCGRSIPMDTGMWHEYTLQSPDGTTAQLEIDGQVVSKGIKPIKNQSLKRGLYLLCSIDGVKGYAEVINFRIK